MVVRSPHQSGVIMHRVARVQCQKQHHFVFFACFQQVLSCQRTGNACCRSLIVRNLGAFNQPFPVHAAHFKHKFLHLVAVSVHKKLRAAVLVQHGNGVPHECGIHGIYIAMHFVVADIAHAHVDHRKLRLLHIHGHIVGSRV